jgi:hypothetical protein
LVVVVGAEVVVVVDDVQPARTSDAANRALIIS